MLKREIKLTADGSPTLYIPEWDEGYHSKHGALQEALHVFIKNGYQKLSNLSSINILEFGFGTGLNALLTLLMAERDSTPVIYHSIEKFPLSTHEIDSFPISSEVASTIGLGLENVQQHYDMLHYSPWNKESEISEWFTLTKIQNDFKTVSLEQNQYDLIYFDAFGKRVQPELWTEPIFKKAYEALKAGGLFTTYACNGNTKRALINIGFSVEKLAGPPGKREMINAWKK